MKTLFFSALAVSVIALGAVNAQSLVIVQPADAAPANSASLAPAVVTAANDSKNMLQTLQGMQTLNAATIKKQEATLVTLDELQKAVEELKIFSKRG